MVLELIVSALGLTALLVLARAIASRTEPSRPPRLSSRESGRGGSLVLCRLGRHVPRTVVVQRFPTLFLELRKTSCVRCSREL